MSKAILFFFLIIALFSPCFAQSDTTESLTITTYYPAPYGVYRNLKLNPTDAVPSGSALSRGVMFYNNSSDHIEYRNQTGWVPLTGGGGGTGYWAENPATHAINNTNPGMVMIDGVPGANGELFHIHGDTRIYSQPQAANEGSILYMERDYDGLTQHHSTISFVNHDGSPGYGVQHMGNPGLLRLIGGPNGAYFNYVVMQNNRVGIGKSNPQTELDVNGNVTATGDICSNGGSNCLNAAAGGIVFTHYCFSAAMYGSPVCTNAGGVRGFCPAGYKQKLALGAWGRCGVSIGGGAGTSGWFYFLPPGGACGPSATFNSGTVGSAYVCSQ